MSKRDVINRAKARAFAHLLSAATVVVKVRDAEVPWNASMRNSYNVAVALAVDVAVAIVQADGAEVDDRQLSISDLLEVQTGTDEPMPVAVADPSPGRPNAACIARAQNALKSMVHYHSKKRLNDDCIVPAEVLNEWVGVVSSALASTGDL